jgi:hypothetical protein
MPTAIADPLTDSTVATLPRRIGDGWSLSGERELIVVAPEDEVPTASREGPPSVPVADTSLSLFAAAEGVRLERLFEESWEEAWEEALKDSAPGASITRDVFCHIEAPDARLEELAAKFREQAGVRAAYIKPRAELAAITPVPVPADPRNDVAPLMEALNAMMPAGAPVTGATPDFADRQGYLRPAPEGLDAHFAWSLPGGAGDGTRVIDLEWGWRFTHEDLQARSDGLQAGTASLNERVEDHGTAVLGVIGADRNGTGVTGIAPAARVGAVAFSMPTARAIRTAAQQLQPGDILLLEIHRAGPRRGFQAREDQKGYVAIEWWPDDFAAIRFAVERGIIVVEAAGNGWEDLDDALYDTPPAEPEGPFPSTWRNPFRRANADSGAIVVGAGAPPDGTHGRHHGPDRSRLEFSNYGEVVDAQGWGREVTTTGYGDLQGRADRDRFYTDQFSGTSSASPMIVGVLACLQGILRARNQPLLNPARARQLLRASGSPQQDAPGRPSTQRIGTRPDLRQLVELALQE